MSPYGGGTRTAFGNDVRSTLSGGLPDWSALYALDSDGDGQSNGEELGDPCGDWTFGDTPARQTDISAPGDSDDLSADPQTPGCGDQVMSRMPRMHQIQTDATDASLGYRRF